MHAQKNIKSKKNAHEIKPCIVARVYEKRDVETYRITKQQIANR